MKLRHPKVLAAILAFGVGAWLLLLWLQRYWEHEAERSAPSKGDFSLIQDGLYQGGYCPEPPAGTQAVLNMCELEDPYRCEIHAWEPIRDGEPAPALAWLRRKVDWVTDQRRAGRTTYVHCRNGASRSALVVIAYVMHEKGWPRDRAVEFVRSKRAVTMPNSAFMDLLLEWEKELSKAAA